MKKITTLLTALTLFLVLCACSQSASATWQEQYDLGIQYLSEGNYREAIIAFSAAIEIDSKRADAYIGLADAYEAQGDVERARQVLEDTLAVVVDTDVIRGRLDRLEGGTNPETTPGMTVEPTHTQEPTSGTGHITWSLIGGTLTISGKGPMEDYENGTIVTTVEKR